MSEKKLKKKTQDSVSPKKQKTLFDHLNQIRTIKNRNYFDTLTDKEKSSWSNWMILQGLSQDESLIQLCAFLWRDGFYDKIPPQHFYTLLCDLIPKTKGYFGWAKAKKKNRKLLKYISQWYSISTREAQDYLTIFLSNDFGMKELANVLEGLGLTDKEAEEVLQEDSKNE